ncbi:hypothetical protein C7460_13810 [Marinoscillum furvescens DSM 4134]|uniref:Uncharacterized protein n=1 Tax=Marinoscillum furvescens DSM 4134 TaxID=1122208 RepID=A0A3D9KWT0_MARFU|nr:hypothetical protein C7460_13810 [Marinoscillum furvescens DSM 4134]
MPISWVLGHFVYRLDKQAGYHDKAGFHLIVNDYLEKPKPRSGTSRHAVHVFL